MVLVGIQWFSRLKHAPCAGMVKGFISSLFNAQSQPRCQLLSLFDVTEIIYHVIKLKFTFSDVRLQFLITLFMNNLSIIYIIQKKPHTK